MSGWARFATVFFILAAIVCNVAGTHMTSIMSVSGSTINEAYYQAMGIAMFGFAAICMALAGCILSFGRMLAGMADTFERIEQNTAGKKSSIFEQLP